MINRIKIKNWQSLQDVDLPLGRMTVIQGPSNSGKSAIMRALRAVTSNVRGSSHITRGAKSTSISVDTPEATVTLERSESTGSYRIVDADGTERVFTKLAGAVPEAVTRALRITPAASGGDSLHFAGQFDRPFLLEESGSAVARVLGELTNVDRILTAVREANRRKASYAATLKTREADLAELKTRAATFRDLPQRLARADAAEDLAKQIAQRSDEADRLAAAAQALAVAEGVLARSSVLPEIPDDAAVLSAQAALTSFSALIRTLTEATNTATAATARVDQATRECDDLATRLHDTLVAAGTCPTCGQSIT